MSCAFDVCDHCQVMMDVYGSFGINSISILTLNKFLLHRLSFNSAVGVTQILSSIP